MTFTQFLLILAARKWVVLGVLFFTIATTMVVTLWLPKEYTATTTLIIDSKSKDPVTGQMLSSQMFPGYMATQVDVIKSTSVAQKVVAELGLLSNPGIREQFMQATEGRGTIEHWLSDLLIKKLIVEPSRESSIISIGFTGSDPRFSAIVANAFAKSYIETNLDLRVAPAKQTAVWFDRQIVRLRENLEGAQQKLNAYQREKGLVESEERLDVETRRMGDLAGQMVAAQSALIDASARTTDSGSLPEVFNSPAVQALKAKISQGEGHLAQMAERVGGNHPDFLRLQAEVATYKASLATELGTATRGVGATAGAARQRYNELKAAFESQKARVLELKQQREEASLLTRDLENAQRIYDGALARYGQSNLEAQSTQTDIAVLNPAVEPMDPSRPRVFLNLLLSLVLGALLAVGVGLLLEFLDRRVRSGRDISALLEIPVLAEVVRKRPRLEALRRVFRRKYPATA